MVLLNWIVLLLSVFDRQGLNLILNYLIVSIPQRSFHRFAQYGITCHRFLQYMLNLSIAMGSLVSNQALLLMYCLLLSAFDRHKLDLILNYLIASMLKHLYRILVQYGITCHRFLRCSLNQSIVTVLLVSNQALLLMYCLLLSTFDRHKLDLILNYLIVSMLKHLYHILEQYGIRCHHFLRYMLNQSIVTVLLVSSQALLLMYCLLLSTFVRHKLDLILNYLIVLMRIHLYHILEQYKKVCHHFLRYMLSQSIVTVLLVSSQALVLMYCLLLSTFGRHKLNLILNYLIVLMPIHLYHILEQYEKVCHHFLLCMLIQ